MHVVISKKKMRMAFKLRSNFWHGVIFFLYTNFGPFKQTQVQHSQMMESCRIMYTGAQNESVV